MNKENFKNLIAHYEFVLHTGQSNAAMNVNHELILLYHQMSLLIIGKISSSLSNKKPNYSSLGRLTLLLFSQRSTLPNWSDACAA